MLNEEEKIEVIEVFYKKYHELENYTKEDVNNLLYMLTKTRVICEFEPNINENQKIKMRPIILTNKENNIIPKTILKEISDVVSNEVEQEIKEPQKMSKQEKAKLIIKLENEMKEAAKNLDFERAMELRDILFELKGDVK